jgi:hypothetical protein
MRLIFDRFAQCSGCIYVESQEKCAGCERNPALSKLQDFFKSHKQHQREVKEHGAAVADETVRAIDEATNAKGQSVQGRNEDFLGEWGIRTTPKGNS